MPLETGTYISDLVATNPTATDPKAEGDDNIRLLKSTIKATFPNVTGAVTPTHTELNYVDGVTSAIQTQLDAKSPSASPTFTGTVVLPATTSIGNVSATEIGYLDGVTSGVQSQLNSLDTLKAPLNSPAFTGAPTAPTATAGDASTKIATTAFVSATAFASALPGQTGNAGKIVTTDGSSASWSSVKTVNGTSLLGSGDIVAGGYILLSTATASSSVAVDFTSSVVNSTYDEYVVVATNVVMNPAASHGWRVSTDGGSTWISANYAHQTVTYNATTVTASQNTSNTLISSPYTSTEPFTIVFRLYSANSSTLKMMDVYGIRGAIGANMAFYNTAAALNATSAINGIRFVALSNDIDSGTFKLYGVKK